MNTSLRKYVKTATCTCGWFEKVWPCEVCPECGNDAIIKKVGRYEFKETWISGSEIIGFKLKEDDND